jgi:hypothetical protein
MVTKKVLQYRVKVVDGLQEYHPGAREIAELKPVTWVPFVPQTHKDGI